MQSTPNGSSFANAFDPAFLRHLLHLGEVSTAPEAELSGGWKVVPLAGRRHGVFRDWEQPGDGAASGDQADAPEAVFETREHALLAAAVLPATGRDPLFALDPVDRPEGYTIESVWGDRWVRTAGRLRHYQPEVVEALHVAETLVRSPIALAHLLEAAGPTALELAGRILRRKMSVAAQG